MSTPFKTKGKQALVRFQPKFDDLTVPDVPNLSDLTVSHSVLTEIKHSNPEYDIQYILDAWREWEEAGKAEPWIVEEDEA